jgi:hypothetical protein
MADYQCTKHNIHECFESIQIELEKTPLLVLSTQSGNTGKWGMARLWRAWMSSTAKFMAGNGCTMPLMLKTDGSHYGTRPFNKDDAHELFSQQYLGADADGVRLGWAKKDHDGMRAATKGERFSAMMKHQIWAGERGIILFNPRDSEYSQLEQEQNK